MTAQSDCHVALVAVGGGAYVRKVPCDVLTLSRTLPPVVGSTTSDRATVGRASSIR